MKSPNKSVPEKPAGTCVAAGQNLKSRGKSLKSKLVMKLASTSLVFGAFVVMLSPMDASADGRVPVNSYQSDPRDTLNNPTNNRITF
ncbi:MAG TPA: hypothetical protein VGP09_00610 [Caballeronia sp.]|nr:hypothetical protein [Caballeronia sp.]